MNQTQYLDRTPFAYEKIAIATDAVSRLDATYRATAKAVLVTFETNAVRYRIDGGNPDADDGHYVQALGSIYFVDPMSIRNLRMIASGGAAVAIVTFYR